MIIIMCWGLSTERNRNLSMTWLLPRLKASQNVKILSPFDALRKRFMYDVGVEKRKKKELKPPSLTIKKHFVRFNLHFKQLKKKL
jgi:hypothetical protein